MLKVGVDLRRRLAVVIAAALMLVIGAAAAGAVSRDGDPPPERGVPALAWQSCGEGAAEFQCATAEVPTDHDDPAGGTTTIALTRLPATEPDRRIGSLFVNFGGPGGPGVVNLHLLGQTLFPPEVRARFDVVAFDPRGVSTSDPVTCFPNAEAETAAVSTFPSFPVGLEQETRYIGLMAALGASCTVFGGDRVTTSSTANVARDMDLLRQAVGDEQLSYVGYSYGTYLAATYGALFPDRVRAMVLDGAVDVEAWTGLGDDRVFGRRIGQHVAAAEAFGEFLRLCAAAGPERCALARLGDPARVVEDTFTRLRTQPVDVPLGDGTTTKVGYDDAVRVAFLSMYSPALWSELAEMAAQLAVLSGASPPPAPDEPTAQSDGAPGLTLPELLRRLGLAEDYPSIGGFLASVCVDAEHPGGPLDYPAQADEADSEARHFGRLRAWAALPCEFMPDHDEDAYAGPWTQTTTAPVLVIGTRFDPATPYRNTAPYASLWPDASVVTVEGYGHTTAGVPSSCATAAIAAYLVELEADDGATCSQDVVPFAVPAPAQEPQRPTVPLSR